MSKSKRAKKTADSVARGDKAPVQGSLVQAKSVAENFVDGEGLVTVPAAARFLQLSRAKVYTMMDEGELPFHKFGRSRRISRRALAELVEKSLVAR
jgi:excisionase family DNA binding protein